VDIWSRATIRKYLPPESKDPKKHQAGKIGGENKKKAMLLLAENTEQGARINLAEDDSYEQNKQESETFHNQLNQQLEAWEVSQELYDISKMLSDKDSEIERLKQERVELQVKMTKVANGIIILPNDLLVKMISESRAVGGGREVKYFYLKAEDGIVTGYETDITRSNNNKNTKLHFNQ
jgi:archaellum component FlaC